MGFQPRTRKTRRNISREYTKPLRERSRGGERAGRRGGKAKAEYKPTFTAQEITEATLKRLHTLGIQKFGSSPFSAHFERWLTDVKVVLSEFEANPNIGVDDELLADCTKALSTIEHQLENRRRFEALLDQEEKNFLECKSHLEKIKKEFFVAATEIGKQRSREVRRLRSNIEHLKKEQDMVVRMKTGFFRGVSKKERERREIDITQKLTAEQEALEIAMLNFKEAKGKLRDDYDRKATPIWVEMRKYQKKLDDGERDDSLEDRWFACEALTDAVNNFLLRKNASASPTRSFEKP
jgi:hypothetical protein